jgi:hypothetical protein
VVANQACAGGGSLRSRILDFTSLQAEVCSFLQQTPEEVEEWVLGGLPADIHGVRITERGWPESLRDVKLVPAPAGHGHAQMGEAATSQSTQSGGSSWSGSQVSQDSDSSTSSKSSSSWQLSDADSMQDDVGTLEVSLAAARAPSAC